MLPPLGACYKTILMCIEKCLKNKFIHYTHIAELNEKIRVR